MKTNAEHESSEGAPLELRPEPECLYPSVDLNGNFTFRFGSPGDRYYLDGQGIHAGDLLEMQLDDGAWQHVRYEYTWNPNGQTLEVILHFQEDRGIRLPVNGRFRWPR